MSKKMKVLVNGNPYEVEIEDLNKSPINVTVNGETYLVELESETEYTVAPVITATPSQSVSQKPASQAPKIISAVVASSSNELRAPMPGLILDIVVNPGSKVTRGQPLLALEAMKMKNAIRAPRDGVIQSIAVSDGQKVAYNDLLVTFE